MWRWRHQGHRAGTELGKCQTRFVYEVLELETHDKLLTLDHDPVMRLSDAWLDKYLPLKADTSLSVFC